MPYVREEIRSNSPQDVMKINENFMNIYEKVFGDINFSDVDTNIQTKLNTQYLAVQGEGNFDKSYPLYVRFFVSPNVKELKSSSFNFIAERYRMDSGVTEGGGSTISEETTKSSGEITSRSSGEATSNSGGNWSSSVSSYNNDMSGVLSDPLTSTESDGYGGSHYHSLGKAYFLHNHSINISIPSHYHTIPGHAHIVPGHTHAISINIPGHTHKLTEGIRVSESDPKDIEIFLNDTKVATVNTTNILNGLDIINQVKIGEWNTIKITTSNLARVSLYGTIETLVR